jgi:hypothetical protein
MLHLVAVFIATNENINQYSFILGTKNSIVVIAKLQKVVVTHQT